MARSTHITPVLGLPFWTRVNSRKPGGKTYDYEASVSPGGIDRTGVYCHRASKRPKRPRRRARSGASPKSAFRIRQQTLP
jgi:hypothetical protein